MRVVLQAASGRQLEVAAQVATSDTAASNDALAYAERHYPGAGWRVVLVV